MSNKGCLGAILGIFGEEEKENNSKHNKSSQSKQYKVNAVPNSEIKQYNYYLRDSILTKPEKNFYEVLLKVTNQEKFSILSQVALIEIFQPTRDNYYGSRGKIQLIHIDFVICRKKDLHPILAIELDDHSHDKYKRKERDKFLDELFDNFELNLLHVPMAKEYDPREISKNMALKINGKKTYSK